MKLIYPLFFSLFLCNLSFAQNKTISGTVSDEHEYIPFAHVYLKTSLIGTITNESGYFSLNYPGEYDPVDTLIVSSIGYKSLEIPLSEIENDSCAFALEQLHEELGEVVVLESGLSTFEIVKKALNHRRKNLTANQYYLEGLYRLTGHVGDDYGHVVEAAIGANVHDRWFDMEKDKIAVYEARSSDNHLERQSYLKEKFGELIRSLNGRTAINELYYIFRIEEIEDLRWGCMGKDWDESFDFTLDKVIFNPDSTKTYVVNFNRKTFLTVSGTFYINSDNWKILRYTSEIVEHESDLPYPQNRLSQQEITYQEHKKKLFPLYIKTSTFGGPQKLYIKNDQGEKVTQYNTLTFMVNFVDPKMRKRRKKFKKFYLPREEYFDPSYFSYNPQFWDSYNMIHLNPTDIKIIEDLSENKSLEEQFIQNGSRL